MSLLELIGIIFIIALVFNIVIAIFALKGAVQIKKIDMFKKEF